MSIIQDIKAAIPRLQAVKPVFPAVVYVVAKALSHDKDVIEYVGVDEVNQVVHVTFSWASRGSIQDEDYTIPFSVFTSPDPDTATRIWYNSRCLLESQQELAEKKNEVMNLEERINSLTEVLHALALKRETGQP